ncbi:siderophore-interacting protein [Achromobacter sp. GG226]|uniref:siderophore-interacting protein n=1 Tax=Verticiella alkaliphila TaxID=2779529 RepID=UPI001C0D4874|nr:siderophore-interacting protein [Verticiella sp. GG226]MBU4610128.1 siderophore-interacting protein [Verticiella sp. GG226]
MTDTQDTAGPLDTQRVRHPLKFRLLQVQRVTAVSPFLRCITLRGDDLQDFVSASFDDHVKLFFPLPGQTQPTLPTATEQGIVFPEGVARPPARDYTPRRFDPVAGELDIEFALHGDGPAAEWAARAAPGDWLGVGGPRGSFVVPTAFDWHVLIGDETALPAMARRLAELPASATALVIAEVPSPDGEVPLPSAARVQLQWLHRDGAPAGEPARFVAAAQALVLPDGEGYVWVAAEAGIAKAVRAVMVERHGINKSRIRAAAYWKRGAANVHETLQD